MKSTFPSVCFLTVTVYLCLLGGQVVAQAEKDPNRPACTSAHCRKVKSFLKAHYCGESPFGNGPDDGCEIKVPERPKAGVEVIANYKCKWDEGIEKCKQDTQPSATMRDILMGEMRKLGLPAKAGGKTYFTVWKSTGSGWTVAAARYSRLVDADVELCDVIVLLDEASHVTLLRKLLFQKTSADSPAVTQWTPVDLVAISADGSESLILQGDAYEDHWLEVVSVSGSPKTIFSGLGYYL